MNIDIHTSDLFCLRNPSNDAVKSSIIRHKKLLAKWGKDDLSVWRHNSLDGVGSRDHNGSVVYETPAMDGLMDPHVFTRFKYIELELTLDFSWDANGEPTQRPMMSIDSDLNILTTHLYLFANFFRPTRIVRDFATIISNSPALSRLWIKVEVDVAPSLYDEL
jgi:hypothetical protein